MAERLLMEGKLSELLTRIPGITSDLPEGFYVLYVVNGDSALAEDRWSAIILSLDEEDEEFVPDEARERNMLAIVHVRTVQSIIRVALGDKPDASAADLVTALYYYMDHDAFIDFSSGMQ